VCGGAEYCAHKSIIIAYLPTVLQPPKSIKFSPSTSAWQRASKPFIKRRVANESIPLS
jgi:hypothetical protein